MIYFPDHKTYEFHNGVFAASSVAWSIGHRLLSELWSQVPMEERVLAFLHTVQGYSYSKSMIEDNMGYAGMTTRPDITIDTALRRLLKQGKVARRMEKRGVYKRWMYTFTANDKQATR